MSEVKTYSHEEVQKACLEYFAGDELAATVASSKYLLRNSKNEYLESSPEQMIDRVAREFARVESRYTNPVSFDRIRASMERFRYIVPQGSPLFGIGNTHQTCSIANCFVVDSPIDSYGGILRTDEELVQIMKRRGGSGLSISTLRPQGSAVNNAAKTSDGILCFMDRFSNTTKEVAQGGRRGALMIALDCMHPQLEDFINIKRNKKRVTGANISVKWTDEFLAAVEDDKEVTLRWPVDAKPEDAKVTKVVKARDVWKQFVRANWESAEPGCLFWDTLTRQSLSDCYADIGYRSLATNPCLTKDTLVVTDKGTMTMGDLTERVPTEDINALTLNIETNELEYQKIEGAFKTRDDTTVIEIELEDGTVLKCTPDHLIYTENRGYVKASMLIEEDIIIKVEK